MPNSLLNRLDAGFQIRDGSLTDALIPLGGITTAKLADGANFLKKDGTVAMTANFNLGNFKITNLAAGVNPTDAVNVLQLSTLVTGLQGKASVRVATTIPLVTEGVEADFAPTSGSGWEAWADWTPGDTTLKIDGKEIVANAVEGLADRILVWKQSGNNAKHNGIYYAVEHDAINERTKLKRASDADSDAEVKAAMYTWVEEGTENADTGFYLLSDNPITLGTTNLTFTVFNSAGLVVDGNGLYKSGGTLHIGAPADGCITVNVDSIEVKVNATNGTLVKTNDGLKFKDVTAGKILIGNGDNVATEQAVTGDVTISQAGVTTIGSNKVVTGMILDNNVTVAKLEKGTAGYLLIGQGAGNTAYTAVTGDVTIDSTGVTAIGAGKVVHSMLAADAVESDNIADDAVGTAAIAANAVTLAEFARQTDGYIVVGKGTEADCVAVAVSGDIALASTGVATVNTTNFASHLATLVSPTESPLTGLTSITPPTTPVASTIVMVLNGQIVAPGNYSWNGASGKIDMTNYTFSATDVVLLSYLIAPAV